MNDSEKLKILSDAIKAECLRLCDSSEPGIEDMRYRLERVLLSIDVKPYDNFPDLVIINTPHDEVIQKANESWEFFLQQAEEGSARMQAQTEELNYFRMGA